MVEKRKIIAGIVSTAIVLNALPGVPFWAAQEETEVICEVEELPEETAFQTVEYGTGKGRLKLPRRLEVMVRDMEDEDTDAPEASASNASRSNAEDNSSSEMKDASPSEAEDASRSNANKDRERKGTVSVRWELEESFSEQDEYDGKVPGIYVFQAELKSDRYELETSLPVIEIQVMEPNSRFIVDDWEWEPSVLQNGELSLPGVSKENQADFDTIVSMLPESIESPIKDENGDLISRTVTIEEWACPEYKQDPEGNWPLSGTYTFRALLPEEYEVSDTAEKLEVQVVIGGVQLYSNQSIQLGSFIVSSPEGLVEGEDYGFEYQKGLGVFEIQSSKEITIEPIVMDMEITDTVISAASGIEANITLKNIIIDVSGISGACAVDLSQVNSATVTVEGSNTLRSGSGRAGLEMGASGIFTIDGEGSLSGYGGDGAAGIGSGPSGSIDSLTIECFSISGYGGENAAGIGGGEYGRVNFVDTRVRIIRAEGGTNGAGLGCGYEGSIGTISMNGGQGTLTGGAGGAGIGTGSSSSNTSGQIRLENTYLVVRGGDNAAGIGGGNQSSGGQIIITGGTVEVTGDPDSEIIGNGVGGGGSSLTIDGASVKADCASRVQSQSGGYNYRCLLKGQGGVIGVIVDGVSYNITHNHLTDDSLYLYLPTGEHKIRVERGNIISEFTVYITGDGLQQRILWPIEAEELSYGQSLKESDMVDGQATDGNYETLAGQFIWKDAGHIPQAGDNQEFAIQFVPEGTELQTLENSLQVNVKPAPLTITAENKTMSVGDKKPEYTATVQGLVNGESVDQITFSDSAGDYSVPGEYRITPGGGIIVGGNESMENYEAVYQPGTLTILEQGMPEEPGGPEDGEEEEQEPGKENEEPQNPSGNETQLWASRGDSDDGETNTIIIDPQKGRVDRDRGILTGTLNGTGGGYSHWHSDADGWRLQYADGSYASGSQMTDGSGNLIEIYRWELINRIWYAFDSRGYVADGMIYDGGYGGWFYVKADSGMKVGWQQIDGKWYYFNPRSDGKMGLMFMNRQTLDGWYVKGNGEWDGQPKKPLS